MCSSRERPRQRNRDSKFKYLELSAAKAYRDQELSQYVSLVEKVYRDYNGSVRFILPIITSCRL
jgi:hypothetical protein